MRVFLTVMKMTTHAIDDALSAYTHQRIYEEINKNIEDVIFFSSYSIDTSIFRKATQKLKKKTSRKEQFRTFFMGRRGEKSHNSV